MDGHLAINLGRTIMTDALPIGLSATSYGFTSEELDEAARVMASAHPVEIRPHQRGGSGWDVEVVLYASLPILQALGPNLAASAIWDGFKLLLTRFRPKHGPDRPEPLITLKINETSVGDRSLEAFIRTDDPAILEEALKGVVEAAANTFSRTTEEWTYIIFEEEDGRWKQEGE